MMGTLMVSKSKVRKYQNPRTIVMTAGVVSLCIISAALPMMHNGCSNQFFLMANVVLMCLLLTLYMTLSPYLFMMAAVMSSQPFLSRSGKRKQKATIAGLFIFPAIVGYLLLYNLAKKPRC